jgi:hypothetical protein
MTDDNLTFNFGDRQFGANVRAPTPGEDTGNLTFNFGTQQHGAPTIPEFEGEPSILERTAGALLSGARRDPLQRLLIDNIIEIAPGVDVADAERLAERIEGSKLADVFELVGEFAPTMAGGVGLFSLGRKGATMGLQQLAKQGVLGSAKGGQGARIAAKAANVVGRDPLAKPGLQRAGEAVGGALGIGGLEGTREAAAGGDFGEILQAAGVGTGLTLGFEGAVVGLGKLAAKSRDVTRRELRETLKRSGDQRIKEGETLRNNLTQTLDQLEAALDTEDQLSSLIARTGKSPVEEAFKQVRQAESAQQQFRRFNKVQDSLLAYTRAEPLNPDGLGLLAQRFLAQTLKTPEGFAGQMGPTLGRALRGFSEAEAEVGLGKAATDTIIGRYQGAFASVLGRKARGLAKDPRYQQMWDLWEREGFDSVEKYLHSIGRSGSVSTAREVFDDVGQVLEAAYGPLVKLGAEPIMSSRELHRLGVRNFVPHVFETLDDQSFLDKVSKGMGGGADGLLKAQALLDKGSKGLRQFGSIDKQRAVAGTLKDKAKSGLPVIEDPLQAISTYMNAVHRRRAYGSRFGFDGELAEPIKRAAVAEGASPSLTNTLVDHFLASKPHDAAMRRLFQNITDFQTGTKLTMAVIPNMSQTINTLLFNGYRNTARSMLALTRKESRRHIGEAVGVQQGIFDVMRHSFIEQPLVGGRFDQALERFARGVLRYSQFERVENFNRMVGGSAALYTIRRDVGRALSGRLRGNSLDQARRRMNSVGLDLDEVVRRGKRVAARTGTPIEEVRLSDVFKPSRSVNGVPVEVGELDRAIFQGSKLTQFIPDLTRRPLFWNHPAGRVLFQFKTFALNQGRFLRDQVLVEAARGNMKPMAYFLSVYPIAGEAVASTRSLLKGKDRSDDLTARILYDLSAVGGFGLATDTMVAARFGRLESSLLGPTVSDMSAVAENLLQLDGEGMFRFAGRQPIAQAARALGTVGGLTVGGAMQLLDKVESREDPFADETVDLGDLLKESP